MATITQPSTGYNNSTPTLWDSFRAGLRSSGLPWLFILPSIVVMFFITFIPQGYQIYISFRDFQAENVVNPAGAAFIGLENFQRILESRLNIPNYNFFPLLGFNIVWTLANVVVHAGFGLLVAVALNGQVVLGRRFYRAIFVLPWALPAYITALIWNNLWQQNSGGINLLLESLNENLGTAFPTRTGWLTEVRSPIDIRAIIPFLIVIVCALIVIWLVRRTVRLGLRDEKGHFTLERFVFTLGGIILCGAAAVGTSIDLARILGDYFGSGAAFSFDTLGTALIVGAQQTNPVIQLFDRAGAPVLAFYAVLVANIWLGWPFMMVVATGALQSIPPDLYEPADVDGATKWEQFTSITLPLLRPAMVPAIMLGTIWTFNQFNVIFFITAGGPRGQTDLLITQAYKLIQQEQLYGAAAAFSIIVFFILLIITLINNRVTQATKSYDEA